jgi:integrase
LERGVFVRVCRKLNRVGLCHVVSLTAAELTNTRKEQALSVPGCSGEKGWRGPESVRNDAEDVEGCDEKTYWDDDIPLFGVRLRKGGSKGWVFWYRLGGRASPLRKIGLGATSAVSAAEARAQAATLYAGVRLGQDLASEKAESERHLLVQAKPLHRLQLRTVDRRIIAGRLTEIGESAGPSAANRLRSDLHTFFVWAMREGLVDANPVANTNRHEEGGSRERVLTSDELRAIWTATAGGDQYSAVVRLLLLLACRRDEVGSLQWSEIDFDQAMISLPSERTKNSKPFDIPLTAAALAILEAQPRRDRAFVFGRGQGGFSGWSKSKTELDQRANIAPWRLHDLRRTASTVMYELGVQPHIVEAVLNHISGHKGGVSGVYNKAAYRTEKAAALVLWAEHVLAVVEGRPAKIVSLRA